MILLMRTLVATFNFNCFVLLERKLNLNIYETYFYKHF